MRILSVILICLALLGAAPAATPPRVLVVGDSLSAAYGLSRSDGWVRLLGERLRRQGYPHEVVNASTSGETTRGALARLPRALERHAPEVVILELGGNDGLRGITLEEMERNLARMVELSQAAGARVLILGMRLPPNYGPAYTERFHAVFRRVADRYGAALVPFFLDGVAMDRALMQADGIHPTAQAQPRLLENVWPALEPLLGR